MAKYSNNFTPKEQAVLNFLVKGFSVESIAKIMGTTTRTTKTRIADMIHKTNALNKVDLVQWAIDSGRYDNE